MSRDEIHGGPGWDFGKCVWAPTRNTGGARWPFWHKILEVVIGDTILHLRGQSKDAAFIGYSIAESGGYETSARPPMPAAWGYSEKFYRADLGSFTLFEAPIPLALIFQKRQKALNEYFEWNKAQRNKARNIFYVVQSGKLQCLNGAYFSEVEPSLFSALFEAQGETSPSDAGGVISVQTGQQLALVKTRIGQTIFAREVKNLYGNACCYPGCGISDARFLIASHIARWSDNEELRGELGNALCLCLIHDKAFEIGLFALSDDFRVLANPALRAIKTPFSENFLEAHGLPISTRSILPLKSALQEHRHRVMCELAVWDAGACQ